MSNHWNIAIHQLGIAAEYFSGIEVNGQSVEIVEIFYFPGDRIGARQCVGESVKIKIRK